MKNIKREWLEALGTPSYEIPKAKPELTAKYEYEDFDLEVYVQRNDPKSFQRIMVALPKNAGFPCPGVVVPFYYPEAMLGFDPVTGESLESFSDITIMADLAKKGYVTACADAYYLTYTANIHDKTGFDLWTEAGNYLKKDNPCWSGMGKLVSDTTLVVDALWDDERVDNGRIGIAGHSLGGKMAFYTGCLDERIKVVVASDFGICYDQSNWEDVWYWHENVETLKEKGMDHSTLLEIASPKPFCLLAGQYDNEKSLEMMKKAKGYDTDDSRLGFINHASGHRPPKWALDKAYEFLAKWL